MSKVSLVNIYVFTAKMPENIDILRKILILSVDKALQLNKVSIANQMEFRRIAEVLISAVEDQGKNIHLTSSKNTTDSEQIWAEFHNYKDALEEDTFQELSEFAVSTYVLPHSNAEVERKISSMNKVKTKLRNRMENKMCTSI